MSRLHADQHIEVELQMDEMDLTAAESRAIYEEIKEYVLDMEDTIFLEKKKVLTNRTIFVKVKGKLFTDVSIFHNYFEEDRIEKACKEGCPNYGKKWSCPPFSKSFLSLEKDYTSACMICFSTQM